MNGRGFGDYNPDLRMRAVPAPPAARGQPMGPADFPIQQPGEAKQAELQQKMLDELRLQSTSRKPLLRTANIPAPGGGNATLDWSMVGKMDRLLMRNKGASSVWFAFDVDGAAVDAFNSNRSFELQANESISLDKCDFEKVGLKCAAAGTATVHAIAFQSAAGTFAGAIA